jgi:hypothetical protein
MINLRPTGEVVAIPFAQTEMVNLARVQMRNMMVVLAARHGIDKARSLFTEAVTAELAAQAMQTGNAYASRFAVEVLLDQAFAREMGEGALPVGYAG